MGKIFMKADSKKHETQKLVNIRKVVERLNNETVKNILFIHPWTGCDAASTSFNQGQIVLKAQRQIWNILQGVKVLAWYGK